MSLHLDPATVTASSRTFAADVAAGLARRPKTIPSSHFYDARGSQLFEQITELPEYYLTDCEREILERWGPTIARYAPESPYRLIELGAGDGHKTAILLRHLLDAGHEVEYVPIDICSAAIEQLTARMQRWFTKRRLQVRGIAGDYFDAFLQLRLTATRPSFVLFLGSSIGNFTPAESLAFLRKTRQLLQSGDRFLIGFDLKKELSVLQRAYDDSAGVTREFNFNLLDRINRELGGEFDREAFEHYATYNLRRDCMESWLVSRHEQRVPIRGLNQLVHFQRCEGVRVERSHKYDHALIHRLAASAKFSVVRQFADTRNYFVDSLWQAD